MSTIFSKIINGELPAHKVAESDDYLAFLDINPVTEGHTLVIPKKEVDYIFDLDKETYNGLFSFANKVAKGIGEVIDCKKVGIAVVGLEVAHAHIHLVPVNKVTDLSFDRPKLKLSQETFEKIAGRINKAIK
jgi:histidine triad (HIT) family protein